MIGRYYDAETLVQDWLKSTTVAALVTRTGGGVNIFQAMPNASPIPSVVLTRVGGAPALRSDLIEDVARISFDCWANSRTACVALSIAIVTACENLAQQGGFVNEKGRLAVAETVSWLWLPDKASDTPRYVVDALFTAIPG